MRLLILLSCSLLLACPKAPAPDIDGGPDLIDAGVEPVPCAALPEGATSLRLGEAEDTRLTPVRRLVLMGGSVEVDAHSRQFVEGANGGDVLVLRASGSVDSYTPYFHDELGASPAPSSTETVRLDDPIAGDNEAVRCRVERAEALWLAGGDQFDYLARWPATLHSALNGLAARGASVGGTSAGSMSLGSIAFDAAFGSVVSAEVLQDPRSADISLVSSAFAQPELEAFIVDTHFSQRDREGRLLVFLARVLFEGNETTAFGIGIDERASLQIESGNYTVDGESDRRVFVYRATLRPDITPGTPLDLSGVSRRELRPGDSGIWPPSFEEGTVVALTVVDGVIN